MPSSAYSRSVQTPSLLLRDPANIYRFPQMGTSLQSALFSLSAGSFSTSGAGVRVELGSFQALHYLTHNGVALDGLSARRVPRYRIGWSRETRTSRVGLAISWLATAEKLLSDRRSIGEYQSSRARTSGFEFTQQVRLSVGLGGGGETFSWDVVVDFTRPFHEMNWEERETFATLTQLRDDRWERTRTYGGTFRPGGTVRFESAGAGRSLIAFGSYRDLTQVLEIRDLRRETIDGAIDVDSTTTVSEEVYGHEWEAGVRWTTGDARRASIHVSYGENRGTWGFRGLDSFGPSNYQERERIRTARIGVALDTDLPWRLRLRSGFSASHTRTRFEARRQSELFHEGVLRKREETAQGFAWGLTRTFGPVDLLTTVSHQLSLAEPFLVLDAIIRF